VLCSNKGDVIHEYLAYNIITIHNKLTDVAWLANETSRKCICLTGSARCINKTVLSWGRSDITEVVNSPDGQIKTSVDPILRRYYYVREWL
jgi:hypothetical protein